MRRLASLLRKPRPLAQAKEYKAQADKQALFSAIGAPPPSRFAIMFKESCFINTSFFVMIEGIFSG